MRNATTAGSALAIALMLACLTLAPLKASATIRAVTSTNDDGGINTLRTLVGASINGDTINFSVTGTITLTNGQLIIGHNLTFTGPSPASLTISGHNVSRVFNVMGTTVSISGLTIADGNANLGGGIRNNGTLTVNNCTLSANTSDAGGGIYNSAGATLTVSNCTLSANIATGSSIFNGGGGIFNSSATATVNNSTLSANTSPGWGGGINNDGGTVAMNNCTLSSNTTAGSGGGIDNVNNGILAMNNCTLSGNAADGGGGGVYQNGGSATFYNTIIAGNTCPTGPDAYGAVTSQGHNLVGNTSGSSGFGATGDLINVNPLLGPLQDNGGSTFTMALSLSPFSAAIDAGDDVVMNAPYNLTTDQRGRPRKSNGHVDIGAVEISPITLVVSNNNDNGSGSLRQAILDVGETITFATNVAGTILLTSGELLIAKSLNIAGPGAKVLTVSGKNTSRIFDITSGAVAVSGLTIANGFSDSGGAIYINDNNGAVSFSACNITSNSVQNSGTLGGGIYVNSGIVTLDSCTISYNRGGLAGGGINNAIGGVLTLLNCTVSSNRTIAAFLTPNGGGIVNGGVLGGQLGQLTLINTTVTGNTSTLGAGISNTGHAVLRSSLIAGNDAATAPDLYGNFDSSGYNLIGITNGCILTNNLSQNQLGSFAAPLDPLLGPLADNGGPTPTHTLLTGSPAIDKGNGFGLASDQRSRARPYDFAGIPNATGGDGSDIGAFELSLPFLNIARTANNVIVSWSASDTGYTLQAKTNLNPAVNWATVSPAPGIVGALYTVTNSSGPGSKFYRLMK